MIGRIHSFETFGTVDGPGIRFVVFMQGCPFRCAYCHNPDTWHFGGGTEYTADEVFNKIKRYIPYFKTSGGGVTVSGGEPLSQADFVAELFRLCKEEGIHTALDTNGYFNSGTSSEPTIPASPNNNCHLSSVICHLHRLLDNTDLVLLDIKHINSGFHKSLTGFPNEPVLSFARELEQLNKPVWIRYVVVPGITDDEISLKKLSEYLKTLKNIEKIELLPFHKMGEYKWKELGFNYTLSETPQATDEDIKRVKKILGI